MEIIAIGDVHGRGYWKQVANTKSFDQLVLLGDYFDSRDMDINQELRNFEEIVVFKQAHPDKVILLIGNHDFHYMPVARTVNEAYSRFQEKYAYEIGSLFQEHISLFQMSYSWNNFLFTHAGVTNTWLDSTGYKGEEIVEFVNELFRKKPWSFLFSGRDPYGDNITQSPIWVRPNSLRKDAYCFETLNQVVGHTPMQMLEVVADRLFFIDTMGSSREYLVLNEEGVRIDKVSRSKGF